ncbi:hypothetical protein PTKIN_Ptkin10aG0058600 [Pterospermum kingtungense]
MSRATVELNFFGTEKHNSCKSQFQKFLDRRRSFRGLQGAISKMNPELIKSVITSGFTNQSRDNVNQIDPSKSFSVPPIPTLPLLSSAPSPRATSEDDPETGPLTIFYNGAVSVFNVSRDKAESILRLAVEGSSKNVDPTNSKVAKPSSDERQLLETLTGDLPIARRKSLQRFLEKRKDR